MTPDSPRTRPVSGGITPLAIIGVVVRSLASALSAKNASYRATSRFIAHRSAKTSLVAGQRWSAIARIVGSRSHLLMRGLIALTDALCEPATNGRRSQHPVRLPMFSTLIIPTSQGMSRGSGGISLVQALIEPVPMSANVNYAEPSSLGASFTRAASVRGHVAYELPTLRTLIASKEAGRVIGQEGARFDMAMFGSGTLRPLNGFGQEPKSPTFWSTVWSWLKSWAAIYYRLSRFITSMEEETTIAQKTLNSGTALNLQGFEQTRLTALPVPVSHSLIGGGT